MNNAFSHATLYVALLGSALTGAACVGRGTYDKSLVDAKTAQTQLKQASQESARLKTEALEKEGTLERLDASCKKREETMVAMHTKENHLSASLADTKKRLAEVKRARLAADIRADMFQDLTKRFQSMVSTGQLEVIVRDQRMVLQLPDDVLFDTGRAELKSDGQAALRFIADVVKTMPDRHFQVAGHTDSRPIQKSKYPSNWELSSARALTVVHFLIEQGVPKGMLSAAGYGDVDPIAPNESDMGRQHNRRTELTLLPMIDEYVFIPEH
jgi:chemotaxis protein MotB